MVKLPTHILEKLKKLRDLNHDEFEETTEDIESELDKKQQIRDNKVEQKKRERARQNANRQINNRK